MAFTLQTDLALRTLLYLAARPGRATVGEIAEFYGVSPHHLSKVAQGLGRAGWVRNQRGARGGLSLNIAPDALTVGAVVRRFEGRGTHLLDCVDTPGVCVIQPGCRLRGVLVEAERRQLEYLDSISLSMLVPGAGTLAELASWTEPNEPRDNGTPELVTGS